MGSDRRTYRVAQAIREQLARRMIESSDERFHLVTITGVTVTKDLRRAKVYWVQNGSDERVDEIQSAFEKAQGYFKNRIAEYLSLRFVPELRFYHDNTLDTVEQVNALLEKADGTPLHSEAQDESLELDSEGPHSEDREESLEEDSV